MDNHINRASESLHLSAQETNLTSRAALALQGIGWALVAIAKIAGTVAEATRPERRQES